MACLLFEKFLRMIELKLSEEEKEEAQKVWDVLMAEEELFEIVGKAVEDWVRKDDDEEEEEEEDEEEEEENEDEDEEDEDDDEEETWAEMFEQIRKRAVEENVSSIMRDVLCEVRKEILQAGGTKDLETLKRLQKAQIKAQEETQSILEALDERSKKVCKKTAEKVWVMFERAKKEIIRAAMGTEETEEDAMEKEETREEEEASMQKKVDDVLEKMEKLQKALKKDDVFYKHAMVEELREEAQKETGTKEALKKRLEEKRKEAKKDMLDSVEEMDEVWERVIEEILETKEKDEKAPWADAEKDSWTFKQWVDMWERTGVEKKEAERKEVEKDLQSMADGLGLEVTVEWTETRKVITGRENEEEERDEEKEEDEKETAEEKETADEKETAEQWKRAWEGRLELTRARAKEKGIAVVYVEDYVVEHGFEMEGVTLTKIRFRADGTHTVDENYQVEKSWIDLDTLRFVSFVDWLDEETYKHLTEYIESVVFRFSLGAGALEKLFEYEAETIEKGVWKGELQFGIVRCGSSSNK